MANCKDALDGSELISVGSLAIFSRGSPLMCLA
jgi:hypothetical protein